MHASRLGWGSALKSSNRTGTCPSAMIRPARASRSASSPLRTELIITFTAPACQRPGEGVPSRVVLVRCPAAVPDMFWEPHDTEPQRGSFGYRTFVLASVNLPKSRSQGHTYRWLHVRLRR